MATEGALRVRQGPNQSDFGLQLDENQIALGQGIGENPVATTIAVPLSGTYSPEAGAVQNLTAVSAASAQYIRVGNIVTVSGELSFTVTTTNTVTFLNLTLPVASNFASGSQLAGVASPLGVGVEAFAIAGEPDNNGAYMVWRAVLTGAMTVSYTYTYRIV